MFEMKQAEHIEHLGAPAFRIDFDNIANMRRVRSLEPAVVRYTATFPTVWGLVWGEVAIATLLCSIGVWGAVLR